MKQSHGGQIPGSSRQNDDSNKTAEKIGEEQGVSSRTVERDAKFSQAVDKIGELLGEQTKNAIYTTRKDSNL